ncbi:tail fiber assembly protein [Yersinia enterocolitica]|nr:tail fiber assembly protein [Yersinia enterocolitica]HEI6739235.1 tail fiber assembly protein [Yersinia enterocolitica]
MILIIITDTEKLVLIKKYIIELNRLDLFKATEIAWPIVPV